MSVNLATSEAAAPDVLVALPGETASPLRFPMTREPQTGVATAELTGLAPDTLYCYRVDDWSEWAGLRTAKVGPGGVAFAAFGDSGTGDYYQSAVYAQLMKRRFDFVAHLGDLAYERGEASELTRGYFRPYTSMIASVAVFPALGNHDTATDLGRPYLDAFVLPSAPDARERYYSFDYGAAHLAVLDTTRLNSPQLAWLERDLAATRQPWRIVLGHHPPYSSGYHGSDLVVRDRVVPILERHGVQLMLSGHEHDYERIKPQRGVHFVVSGGGGRETRPVSWSPLTAYADETLHFLIVEVLDDQLLVHAIDGVGREFDSLRIEPG